MNRSASFHPRALLAAGLLLVATGAHAASGAGADRANAIDCEAIVQATYWDLRQEGRGEPFPLARYRDVLAERAERTAREVSWLRAQRGRDLSHAEVQAEIDRMARDTRAPEALAKLFKALGNDAQVIGECLAKPALVDRLARQYFARNAAIHAGAARLAAQAHATEAGIAAAPSTANTHGLPLIAAGLSRRVANPATTEQDIADLRTLREFNVTQWQVAPDPALAARPRVSPLVETDAAFLALRGDYRDGRLMLRVLRWPKVDFDAWWARTASAFAPDYADKRADGPALVLPQLDAEHVGQWRRIRDLDTYTLGSEDPTRVVASTGSEILLWSGRVFWQADGRHESDYYALSGNGLAYNPVTDSWRQLPSAGAPKVECGAPQGTWTGSKLLVFVGQCTVVPRAHQPEYPQAAQGALYDPVANAWQPIPLPPSSWNASGGYSLVWTGTKAIFYGGATYDEYDIVTRFSTGAIFDPATMQWTGFSITPAQIGLATSERIDHQAIWTGSTMLVFGGNDATWGCEAPLSSFAFNPFTGVGAALPARPAGARGKLGRVHWTGSVALFYRPPFSDNCGGTSMGGLKYTPASNAWATLNTSGEPPLNGPTALVGNNRLVVWSGQSNFGGPLYNQGYIYRVDTNSWSSMSTSGAPRARYGHYAAVRGDEVIVFGGECEITGTSSFVPCDDAGRYNAVTNKWRSAALPPASDGPPSERVDAAVAGNGTELFVWGGGRPHTVDADYADGRIYDSATDRWTPITASGAPGARSGVFGAFANGRFLVWGGMTGYPEAPIADGKTYDPVARTWTAMPAPPLDLARAGLARTWDGAGLVAWGGSKSGVAKADGARFNAASNTWSLLPATGAPSARAYPLAVSDGAGRTLLWRGESGAAGGAVYASATNTWTPVPANGTFPAGTFDARGHSAVWLGDRFGVLNQGADPNVLYRLDDIASGQWSAASTDGAPEDNNNRSARGALWTGRNLLVWGHVDPERLPPVQAGWLYQPGIDRWMSTPDAGSPYAYEMAHFARVGNMTAVWGGEMRNSGSLWLDDTRTGPLSADLRVGLELASHVGEQVQFRVTATNAGPATATAVELELEMASHFYPPSAFQTGALLCDAKQASGTSGRVRCTYDALAPGETVQILVSTTLSYEGAAIANARVRSGGIESDPVPGNNTATVVLPALTVADANVVEGDSGTKLLTFVATLSQATTIPVVFNVAIADGTATAGSDYVATSFANLSIPAGQLSKAFTVTVKGDAANEPTETLLATLAQVRGANWNGAAATGFIINNDGPRLSVNDVAVGEGASGQKQMTFTVSLSQAATGPVTYQFRTRDGTALYMDADYGGREYAGQIPAGQLTATHNVPINGDAKLEDTEVFFVNLREASGASVWDGEGVGYILNDDGPTLSVPDVSAAEGQAGTKVMNVTVKLSQAAAVPVTFSITTANVSATGGSDYTALDLDDQVIPAGQTSKVFPVTITGDATVEANEVFTITLSEATGATLYDRQAIATIYNDDGPTLSINDVALDEGHAGTTLANFTVTLSQPSAVPVTYTIATSNVTALAGSDYGARNLTETMPAGQTTKTFAVAIAADTTPEADESFRVTLSNISAGATLFKFSGTGMITNDD